MSPLLFAHLLVLSVVMGLLLAAALGDLKTYRIPNTYSLALLALYPLYALTSPHSVAPLMSLGIMALVLVVGFIIFSLRVMGGGDVKLMTVVSLFAGPSLVTEFLLVTALVGGGISLLLLSQFARFGLASTFDTLGNRTLRDALLTNVIPYGLAIAAGGVFVTLRLVSMASAAV